MAPPPKYFLSKMPTFCGPSRTAVANFKPQAIPRQPQRDPRVVTLSSKGSQGHPKEAPTGRAESKSYFLQTNGVGEGTVKILELPFGLVALRVSAPFLSDVLLCAGCCSV